VNIRESFLRDGRRDSWSEERSGRVWCEVIQAMGDAWLDFRPPEAREPHEERCFGRARAAPRSDDPFSGSLGRPSVRDLPDGFDDLSDRRSHPEPGALHERAREAAILHDATVPATRRDASSWSVRRADAVGPSTSALSGTARSPWPARRRSACALRWRALRAASGTRASPRPRRSPHQGAAAG